ncbi:DNA methyltransferase, partial [Gottfriedia sp. NPDC056225]|uniref:DNA methyltransferase n=1 Tax=Gottfriedia sp. NPDC056225 TaxID=3345751 RepID=UPI0035D6974E
YKYYAGFSEGFVEDILGLLEIKTDDIIFDPWNGSGTTTYVSSIKNIKSIGIDMNPVMTIIAKARLQDFTENDTKIKEILTQSRKYRTTITETDALCNWFSIDTVKKIRNIERAILDGQFIGSIIKDDNFTINQSFYCLALFNSVKMLSKNFKSSNPTWLKKPIENNKVKATRIEIEKIFLNELKEMNNVLSKKEGSMQLFPEIKIGESENININDESIDVVITSPPYCTRLDYAVMTSIELAILNLTEDDFVKLRHSLIGAPVIHKEQSQPLKEWGKTCLETLKKIELHVSRASKSYYLKTYQQYFDSIYASLKEINRVLKKGGKCTIVVQNSFYKDILVDLKEIFIEILKGFGWELVYIYEFNSDNNLVDINTKSKKYRVDSKIKEFAIIFRKGE